MTRKKSPEWSEQLKRKRKDSAEQAQEADRQATRDFEFRFKQVARKAGWNIHEYR
jgi:ubiquitin